MVVYLRNSTVLFRLNRHFYKELFMEKQNLTRASQELFRRSPDESFESLGALSDLLPPET